MTEASASIDATSGSKRLAAPLDISEPKSTLYVSNVDWSIKKPVLRRALHALFGRHGKILDVVALRREGLRGQAWVIFADVSAASAALRTENGFTFFGRPLKVSYAREKSDRVAKLDGTYVPKDRRAKRAKLEAERGPPPSAQVENPSILGGGEKAQQQQLPPPPPEAPPTVPEVPPPPVAAAVPPPPPAPPASEAQEVPSKILFAQDLPAECNEMMLAMLFRQHSGYREVRIPRPGLAFVEFEDEPHATLALKALNGFKLTTTDTLNLRYGKA